MSELMRMIEKLGTDSELRHAQRPQLDLALREEPVEALFKSAIAEHDVQSLRDLLGARSIVSCLVLPSKQDEDDSEQKEDDDEKEAPDKDNESAIRRDTRRVVSIR